MDVYNKQLDYLEECLIKVKEQIDSVEGDDEKRELLCRQYDKLLLCVTDLALPNKRL